MSTTVNRRRFLSALGAATAALGARAFAAQGDRRPNFVFIMADDLGRQWLSCYGCEEQKTPNLDALAAGGLRFKACYATPLCTPTRVELLTGRYGFRIRWSLMDKFQPNAPKNRLNLNPPHVGWTSHWDVPRWGGKFFDWNKEITFARVLREAGYATAIAGKWQINDFRVHPDALDRHGFDEHCVWTGFETGNPPSANRYWDPYIQINGRRPSFAGKFGPDVFCDFLIEFMRRNRNRPFLAYYPMVLVHGPHVPTPHNKDALGGAKKGRKGKELYAGMVAYADYLVGRIARALDELGLRENTIIFFTGDNGSPGVPCRAWGREVRGGKGKLTELGICLPLIVNCPGLVPGGRVTEELADFSCILPTLAELASAPLPRGVRLDGQSLAPLLLGKPGARGREWIFSQLGDVRVVRDHRFKLYSTGQLYDLQSDPFEERDISQTADAQARAARQRLEQVLAQLTPARQ